MLGAALLLVLGARHPLANLRIEAAAVGDMAPRRVQAVVDLGVIGVTLLYTWSDHASAR